MSLLAFIVNGLKRAFIVTLVVMGLGGCSGWVVQQSSTISFGSDQGSLVTDPPPPLPDYVQPECPAPGYLWVPGYWARSDTGYYWVPGTWVEPPQPEVLWTPGYWDETDAGFVFHEGYWSRHVGFYGGVNYGYGYAGSGYQGGHWDRGRFSYNRAVNNVDINVVHNTYNETVIDHSDNRSGFNGGNRKVQPSPQDQIALAEPHLLPTTVQASHQGNARNSRALYATENHGAPPVAATARPGALENPNVVPTRTALPEPDRSPDAHQQHDLVGGSRSSSLGAGVNDNTEAGSRRGSVQKPAAGQAPQDELAAARSGRHPSTSAPSPQALEQSRSAKAAAPDHPDKDRPRSSN